MFTRTKFRWGALILAIPLLAAMVLHANPGQMGLLRAAEFAPFLIFTLPAGVWADFGIRRPLMISTNFVQSLVLTFVPIAARGLDGNSPGPIAGTVLRPRDRSLFRRRKAGPSIGRPRSSR